MNTRRYPRTMDEAFGAYQRSSQCEIVPMPDERDGPSAADFVLYIVAVIAICVVVKFGDAPEPTNNQPSAQVASKEQP
uniref:Uncharacterized protein n=1 Tax=Variovorax sp. HH01 TaxID=1084736 RepID=I3PCS8_9BURK|nr:hypothetical protein var108 [Variovorax sp. HH01]